MSRHRDYWFKFFPEKWRSDAELRACSAQARGVWMELICLAHRHGGYVLVNGQVPTLEQLAMQAGLSQQVLADGLAELTRNGVCSAAESGAIMSRRMVKNAEQRAKAQEHGRRGGRKPVASETPNHTLTETLKGNARESLSSLSPLSSITALEVDLDLPASGSRAVLAPEAIRQLNEHKGCFPAYDACGRGLCVPMWLGSRWVRQYGGDAARVNDVITAVVMETVGPVGDKPKDFWEAKWAQRHVTHARTGPATKTAGTMDAGRRVLDQRRAVRATRALPGEVVRAD